MEEITVIALKEAIERAGSQRLLAERISSTALPVGQSHVSMWLNRKNVPAEYCPAIERETGVRCERLNPRADWSYLRKRRA